jgi:hypothetical protein
MLMLQNMNLAPDTEDRPHQLQHANGTRTTLRDAAPLLTLMLGADTLLFDACFGGEAVFGCLANAARKGGMKRLRCLHYIGSVPAQSSVLNELAELLDVLPNLKLFVVKALKIAYFKHDEAEPVKAITKLTNVCKKLRERGVRVIGNNGATISVSWFTDASVAAAAGQENAPKRGEVRTYRHSF